jgi:NADH-quinone oxidoreductase subunit J
VRQLYQRWWIALVVAAALFGLLIVPTVFNYGWNTVPPATEGQPSEIASSVQIGAAFMRQYLLPFEIASVLLLVALIGAIVIAYEERSARRKVLTLAEEVAQRQQRGEPQRGSAAAATTDAPEVPAGGAPSS